MAVSAAAVNTEGGRTIPGSGSPAPGLTGDPYYRQQQAGGLAENGSYLPYRGRSGPQHAHEFSGTDTQQFAAMQYYSNVDPAYFQSQQQQQQHGGMHGRQPGFGSPGSADGVGYRQQAQHGQQQQPQLQAALQLLAQRTGSQGLAGVDLTGVLNGGLAAVRPHGMRGNGLSLRRSISRGHSC